MIEQIGRKFDVGKPEMSLLPPWALEAVARVLTIGAQKYERDNWKYVPDGAFRYKNAAMRHLNEYIKGITEDPETGENHLAHAICCLMFMLDSDESGVPLAPADTIAKQPATKQWDFSALNQVSAQMHQELKSQQTVKNLSGVAYYVGSV